MAKYKYSSGWTNQLESNHLWNLYWYQQRLISNRINTIEKIVEIGVGSKFTYNYLKDKGYNITSIDIDSHKKPDIVLNIVDCEPADLNYDVLIAFNVFEHIPYNEFLNVIEKIRDSSITKMFLGLPINQKLLFRLSIQLGRYFSKDIRIKKRRNKITAKHHHWELGYKHYNKEKILLDLHKRNYVLMDSTFLDKEAFFYLKKVYEL